MMRLTEWINKVPSILLKCSMTILWLTSIVRKFVSQQTHLHTDTTYIMGQNLAEIYGTISCGKKSFMLLVQDRAVRCGLHPAAFGLQPRQNDDPEMASARLHGSLGQDFVGHRAQDHSSRSRRKDKQRKKLKKFQIDHFIQKSHLSTSHH